MGKNLSYFKFVPSAWDNGNIQICSRESKGLFVDLCAMYWVRLGEVPYALALQKHCNGDAECLQELIDAQVLRVDDSAQIVIDFLDEQLNQFIKVSEIRRESANKRWNGANALQEDMQNDTIKRREDKSKEDNNAQRIAQEFDQFWDLYDRKIDKARCLKIWKKLTDQDREEIFKTLPAYLKANPDLKFRKHPKTYLSGRNWEDEILAAPKKPSALSDEERHRQNRMAWR